MLTSLALFEPVFLLIARRGLCNTVPAPFSKRCFQRTYHAAMESPVPPLLLRRYSLKLLWMKNDRLLAQRSSGADKSSN